MRKILLAFLAVCIVGVFSSVKAENYTGRLSTFTVASGTHSFVSVYPNVAGGMLIDKLTFSTTSPIVTPVLIGVYDHATSTITAAVDAYWVMIGTGTSVLNGGLDINYPAHNPLKLTNPGFFKAQDRSETIYMNIQYR